jgi:hypothetical protein
MHEKLVVQGEERFGDRTAEWARRLMDARLSLAATPAERMTAIREYLDRMKSWEAGVTKLVEQGRSTIVDGLEVKYFRLEAEQLLAKEEEVADQNSQPLQPRPATPAPDPRLQ